MRATIYICNCRFPKLFPIIVIVIIVTGGYDDRKPLKEILNYDFFTETWTAAGQLTEAKFSHAVAPIPDIPLLDALKPLLNQGV